MSYTLVLNAGSSTLKYHLFHDQQTSSNATIEIGGPNSIVASHREAFNLVVRTLHEQSVALEEIQTIGHRFVHGGTKFTESVLISESVIKDLHNVAALAPLHNPKALEVIEACIEYFPNTPQVAVFDTAFHMTLDEATYRYPINKSLSDKFGIRKYGFHGTSHGYVAEVAASQLGKALHELNAITCHLGAGSSITVIERGRSIDTSMGFTPLAGLMMGTRSGDIDPGVILFLLDQGYEREEIDSLLNHNSGLLGIAATSDMREVRARSVSDSDAKLAREMYIQRVVHYIGAYLARVPGVEVIVFTGGIGENDQDLRDQVVARLQHLFIGSSIPVLVIATNEELAIARECWKVEIV